MKSARLTKAYLKLMNNSSILEKGNHDRNSVWVSDLNKQIFTILDSPSVFSIDWKDIWNTRDNRRLTAFLSTSKFVKNTLLRVVFSPIVSVFGNVVKHGLSCMIYYLHTVSSVCTPIYTRLVNIKNRSFITKRFSLHSFYPVTGSTSWCHTALNWSHEL